MQQNVKPWAEIKGSVKEANLNVTWTGNAKPDDGLGMLGGAFSPMFGNR